MAELLLKDEVYAIVGAAMEVFNHLGPGFLEPIYQEAMEIETIDRQIPTKPQHELVVRCKGKRLKKFYIADLICYDQVIVEIKAIDNLTPREESQLINYLKATGMKVGLLINFGSHGKLEWRRLIFTEYSSTRRPPRYLRETKHNTIFVKISED
jgi:GxxExxY protein